jgi:hypothetical protein
MINHYYRHKATGAMYAVQTSRGQIMTVRGPLTPEQITLENLHRFTFGQAALATIQDRNEYEQMEPGMLQFEESRDV